MKIEIELVEIKGGILIKSELYFMKYQSFVVYGFGMAKELIKSTEAFPTLIANLSLFSYP